MDESSDKGTGDGVDKKAEGQAAESKLPVVWSPKLDAGAAAEDHAATLGADEAAKSSDDAAAHAETAKDETTESEATPQRSWRFALLAATIALAAADRLIRRLADRFRHRPSGGRGCRSERVTSADASAVLRALKAQVAELTAMKSSLDGAARNANTQFAAISDRLDKVERTAAAPSAQLAHIADTVDRLDKINAAPETTGSIGTSAPPTPSDAKITDRIVQDWMVQDVHGDRALVESRSGGLFEVGAGSVLPGLGKVESVKRQDGQWVVVTARGLITSGSLIPTAAALAGVIVRRCISWHILLSDSALPERSDDGSCCICWRRLAIVLPTPGA